MFSDSCRNFHQLSKFAIKNLVKGRKVKFMAFYWPFWPLKVKFWNIMQLTRSCQAFSFGFVSLNDLILKIIFGSPITRRDYVVHYIVIRFKSTTHIVVSLGALEAHMIGMRHIIPYVYSPVVIKIAFGRELLFFYQYGCWWYHL